MRLEVGLILQIAEVVTTHVMSDQRDRDNEGDDTSAMVFDRAQQLVAIATLNQSLEMTDGVHHDVGVPSGCGRTLEGGHEQTLVSCAQVAPRICDAGCHQTAEFGVPGRECDNSCSLCML